MNRAQKIAAFNLIVMLLALAIVLLSGFMKLPHLVGAIELIFVSGLIFASPLLFRRKLGRVSFDERDAIINKRATTTAYTVFWIAFIFICLIPMLALGPRKSIPVSVLPFILFCGAIIVRIVWSVTIIVQYGRGNKNAE